MCHIRTTTSVLKMCSRTHEGEATVHQARSRQLVIKVRRPTRQRRQDCAASHWRARRERQPLLRVLWIVNKIHPLDSPALWTLATCHLLSTSINHNESLQNATLATWLRALCYQCLIRPYSDSQRVGEWLDKWAAATRQLNFFHPTTQRASGTTDAVLEVTWAWKKLVTTSILVYCESGRMRAVVNAQTTSGTGSGSGTCHLHSLVAVVLVAQALNAEMCENVHRDNNLLHFSRVQHLFRSTLLLIPMHRRHPRDKHLRWTHHHWPYKEGRQVGISIFHPKSNPMCIHQRHHFNSCGTHLNRKVFQQNFVQWCQSSSPLRNTSLQGESMAPLGDMMRGTYPP